jgi:hypothetical protein
MTRASRNNVVRRCFRQGVSSEGEFSNDLPGNEMFLNNALQHHGRTGVIPSPFGINHGDGPAHTDAQAISFGSINQRLRPDQTKLVKSLLQKFPRDHPLLFRAALCFGLVGTQKNMPSEFFQPQFLDFALERIRHDPRRVAAIKVPPDASLNR